MEDRKSNNRFRITSIIIAVVMLAGAFGALIGPFTINVSAAPDTHTWDGGASPDRLASNGTNWVSDIAPEAGDSVIFDAGALPATWNLAITLASFSTTAGYSGTITFLAATNWGTTGDITLNGGVFAGVITSTVTCGGNFVDSCVVIDSNLNLVMTGTGKTISGTGDLEWFKSLRFSGDTTLSKSVATTWEASTLIIDAGITVTLNGPSIKLEIFEGTVLTNNGEITGTGYVLFSIDGANRTLTTASTGTINSPVIFRATVGASANHTCTLDGDIAFGSTLRVDSVHASRTLTLDLSTSNYNLTVANGITIGTRGIINGRNSVITCFSLIGYPGVLSGTPTLNILGELTLSPPSSYLVVEPTNPNRHPTWVWDKGIIAEQNDFKVGNSYISWYRGGDGDASTGIGYQTSIDGITWTPYAGNPIMTGYIYLTVIYTNGCYYMFAHNISDGNLYLFNLTSDHTSPSIMNGGNPVYSHSVITTDWDYQIFNVGVAIVNGTWHMMVEGKAQGASFALGYAYSSFVSLDWTGNRSANYVILFAGNPILRYISERDSILMLYGSNVDPFWETRAAYVNPDVDMSVLANWHLIANTTFNLNQTGIHICDPEILSPFDSQYGMSISYGWDQTWVSQKYYAGTLLQFFCQIAYNAYPLTPYLRTGYNIVSANYNKAINWNTSSVLSTISIQTDQDLFINLTRWSPTSLQPATWTVNCLNPYAIATFTLSGLESGRMYRVYIDGVSSNLLTASGSGVISFTYSGPWSEHQFEIVATSITGSISPLVNLIFIMFGIGVVVGVIVEGTYSLRKKEMLNSQEMIKSVITMVIYIVIGIASLGVLYSIVA
jgi:uncharacterized membrane protein YuzA (DUF378 family)